MKAGDNQNGFTLLEALIMSSIFVIVLIAVYMSFESGQKTVTWGEIKAEVQQTARVAMGMMANEIRTAGYDPSNAITLLPTTAVQAANPNTVTFIGDVDGDNVTDRVTYRLQGTQVIRDFSSWIGAAFPAPGPDQLADGVTALTFAYFDGNDVEILPVPIAAANLPNIRRITIGLTTQAPAGGKPETFPLIMDVRLRNL